MAISLLRDNIIGLWLVTLLYGIHIVIFVTSIYIILSRWRKGPLGKGLLATTVLLFACATTQMVCTLLTAVSTMDLGGEVPIRTQMALKVFGDGETGRTLEAADPQRILDQKNFANLVICVEYAVTIANVLLTDGLLIWRCYMVWTRQWKVVIIPVILLLAGSGVGFGVTVVAVKMYLLRYHAPADAPLPLPGWNDLSKQVGPLAGACYTIYFVNNVGSVAWRIWSSARGVNKHLKTGSGRRYMFILHVMVESGALYALALFVLAILCWLNNPLWGFFEDLANGLAGIIPTLVIVLVGLNRDHSPGNITTHAHRQSLPSLEFHRPTLGGDTGLHIDLDPMRNKNIDKGHSIDMTDSDTTGTMHDRRSVSRGNEEVV
ncbi:hypothetical protein NEOLEDRAFT_1178125 [Neolentinus lepideus HHB14362 ss-1]|uniref:Uncharacterized protein n=1 Tax=Neolentinus lepideus HHB14362 ss-1 TaxID=1314782 RepID=A0A165STH3_9AGAM|nr:hypothetical protein NEOLEDRAFT_1178125 [Neolentinus lepideus HHB14362 ss-1]